MLLLVTPSSPSAPPHFRLGSASTSRGGPAESGTPKTPPGRPKFRYPPKVITGTSVKTPTEQNVPTAPRREDDVVQRTLDVANALPTPPARPDILITWWYHEQLEPAMLRARRRTCIRDKTDGTGMSGCAKALGLSNINCRSQASRVYRPADGQPYRG